MALILTKAGLAALAEAEESGTKLQATHMALGDGNGSVPEHTTSSSSLINEVWRGALQSITINEQGDSDAGKQVVFEVHVPINAGGWYIREVALYAGDVLLAIGTHPVMWKPAPEEPTKMEHVIKAPVTFGNAGAVSLIVDPTVVLASQEFVNKQLAEHNGSQDAHPYLKKLLNEHTHAWSVITGKPFVFPPAGHNHTPSQVGLGNLPNAKSDSVTSTSGNSLATSKAVKIAYDKGKQALDLAGQKAASNHNHNSVYATKTHTHTPAQAGLGNLPNAKSDVVNSTRSDVLATSKAAKIAYDKGVQALTTANTKAASNHNHDSRYYTEGEVNSKLAGLVVKPIGLIELMPFRPDALPAHHHMCNGEGLLKTSAAGKRLRSLSSTFKSDWGITENSTHVFLPNVFSGNDGYFFRPVNGSSRRVGNKQSDVVKSHAHSSGLRVEIAGGNTAAVRYGYATDNGYSLTFESAYSSTNGKRPNTSSAGSSEGRPKNIGMTPVIYLPPL